MKIISYIPIALFIIVNTVYDFFYIPKSTNWSIIYFAGMYTSLFIWLLSEFIKGDKIEKLYFGFLALGMLARILVELSKIGMNYDAYMISINDKEKALLFAALVIGGLSLVVHKIWKNSA